MCGYFGWPKKLWTRCKSRKRDTACAKSWVFWFDPLPAIFCSSYVLCIFLSCIHNLSINVYMRSIVPSIIIMYFPQSYIGYMWQRRRWHVLEKILNVVWMIVLPPDPRTDNKMLHLFVTKGASSLKNHVWHLINKCFCRKTKSLPLSCWGFAFWENWQLEIKISNYSPFLPDANL